MTRVVLDYEDIQRLEKSIAMLPKDAERTVNEILHNDGADILTKNITALLPVSKRNKKHAKYSNPFKTDSFNLGVIITTKGGAANKKGSFGYLVFPDEGRGVRNPRELAFGERGLQRSTPTIVSRIEEIITSKLEEEL